MMVYIEAPNECVFGAVEHPTDRLALTWNWIPPIRPGNWNTTVNGFYTYTSTRLITIVGTGTWSVTQMRGLEHRSLPTIWTSFSTDLAKDCTDEAACNYVATPYCPMTTLAFTPLISLQGVLRLRRELHW